MANSIFLHNKAINYRIPLFKKLLEKSNGTITFFFYRENDPTPLGKIFPPKHFGKVQCSFSALSAIAKTEYDILILSGAHDIEVPFFWLIAKIRRKKIIFWTETWLWKPSSRKNTIYQKLFSIIVSRCDAVLYPGTKVQEMYTALAVPQTKQFHIPNTSAPNETKAKSNPYTTYQTTNTKTILFMGRLLPRKGLEFLIQAFIDLPDENLQLLIGGSGDKDYEIKCKTLAQSASNIHFVGHIETHNVKQFLSLADVYVYPSANVDGMAEPWGLSINEVALLNKPIIATSAVAAAYDFIDPGKNGYIVEDKNIPELTKAIKKALALDMRIIEQVSKEKTALHTYNNMAEGFIEGVHSVL